MKISLELKNLFRKLDCYAVVRSFSGTKLLNLQFKFIKKYPPPPEANNFEVFAVMRVNLKKKRLKKFTKSGEKIWFSGEGEGGMISKQNIQPWILRIYIWAEIEKKYFTAKVNSRVRGCILD